MNDSAKAKLVRQLVEGCHHFARCEKCGEGWASEEPMDHCATWDCGGALSPDRARAEGYYRYLIDAAIADR